MNEGEQEAEIKLKLEKYDEKLAAHLRRKRMMTRAMSRHEGVELPPNT